MKFEELVQKAKKISLEPREKAVVRHWLEHLARPVANSLVTTTHFQSIFSRFKPVPILASIMLMSILSGGISFAAENSLPGDLLYPVKVQVNENVVGLFSFTEDSKANWEARRVERRLEEAVGLAFRGNLDSGRQEILANNFEKQIIKLESRIVKMESEAKFARATEISNRLETAIAIREKIAAKFESSADAEMPTISFSLESAATPKIPPKSTIKRVSPERATKLTQEIKPEQFQSAAEGIQKAATAKISEVKNFLTKFKDRLANETREQARIRLASADQTFLEGDAKLKSKDYKMAFDLFRQAHRVAQEAKLILQAEKEYKIQIQFNSNHETDGKEQAKLWPSVRHEKVELNRNLNKND